MTLTQYAMMANSPLVQAVTFSLIQMGNVMQDIPFVTAPTLFVNGVRFEGNLPNVNWVTLNSPPVPTTGTPKKFQESAFQIRNTLPVDIRFVQDRNRISDPRATQMRAYLESITYEFNNVFINNNHVTGNADAVVGLRARLDDPTTYGVLAENKINAGAVDLTVANATNASFSVFLEYISQLLWSVGSPDGTNVVLYLNENLWRRWDALAGRFAGGGGFSTSQDQLGRGITRYKNAVLRDIGRLADQTTKIITSTETAAGANGSSTHTSIYAVHYSPEYFSGWQFEPLMAKDLGLNDDGVLYRTLIDWCGGLLSSHTRSMGRVYGIKLA